MIVHTKQTLLVNMHKVLFVYKHLPLTYTYSEDRNINKCTALHTERKLGFELFLFKRFLNPG